MQEQIEFYACKLAYEIDPADLWEALRNHENIVVIDAR